MEKLIKALWIPLLCLSVLAADLCISFIPGPPPDPPEPPPPSTNPPTSGTNSLTMPLEVLGPPDSTISVNLVSSVGALTDTLSFRAHHLVYEGKAEVRLNSGTWVPVLASYLWASNEVGMFGIIGEVVPTVRVRIPATSWTPVNGTNTVDFKFVDTTNRLSIGYRVLELNLMHAGTNLIPDSDFTEEDPTTWVAPTGGDPVAGANLWFTATITEPTLDHSPMIAHCTDCHAWNGRDLKQFNFSNKSIIERAVFHGLTYAQGTNIAAYIRGLSVPYMTNGRPWNPPYQPGPGMDSVPVYQWAGGAGLDAVLENDLESFDRMFPDGYGTNKVNFRTQALSAREVQVAFQMPDIFMWWPRRHPRDIYVDYWATNATPNFISMYPEVTNSLATRTGTNAASYFNGRKSVWDSRKSYPGEPPPRSETSDEWNRYSLGQKDSSRWRIWKTWEVMTEPAKDLQEYGVELFGVRSDDRRWFHGEIFNTAPHKRGIRKFPGGGWASETAMWYQLQLVMNSGNRSNPSIVPLDWGYQFAFSTDMWDNPAGMVFYAVTVLDVIKGNEVLANSTPPTSGQWPWRGMIGLAGSVGVNGNIVKTPQFESVPLYYRTNVCNTVWSAWLNELEQYPTGSYSAVMSPSWAPKTLANMITIGKAWGVDVGVRYRLWLFGTTTRPDYTFPSPF